MTTLTSLFTNIANAIRSCTGRTEPIAAKDFLTSIMDMANDDILFSLINKTVTTLNSYHFEGVTQIDFYTFDKCVQLTSITLSNSITDIHPQAFSDCINLTTINVPWSEGEVAGAPWGATNATINYNYTGE